MTKAQKFLVFTAAAAIPLALVKLTRRARIPLRVAPSVDLERYMGKWYEIARLPNRFERACDSHNGADYTLRPDGLVTVVNSCRKPDGKPKSVTGTARQAEREGPNTKLKVTFFWPFSGNYWIIDLDAEYRWAVVGEPGRKYFWILSRTPKLEHEVIRGIRQRAEAAGYDLSTLVFPEQ